MTNNPTVVDSKCNIIRDMSSAILCGLCTGNPSNKCPEGLQQSLCDIPAMANNKMSLFATKYSPEKLMMNQTEIQINNDIERNLEMAIANSERNLLDDYPNLTKQDINIRWFDLPYCTWNVEGTPDGPNLNIYYDRQDAIDLGMDETHLIGGNLLSNLGSNNSITNKIPMIFDYLFNPGITIFIIIIIFIISTTLIVKKIVNHQKNQI